MIVPAGAVLVATSDPDVQAELFPQEEAALGSVGLQRRRDFSLGRQCARRALAGLGLAPLSILPGPSREPIWPQGVCGSITHCQGYWAAAVAWQSQYEGIGVDAEPRRELPRGILPMIASPDELEWINNAKSAFPWELLLFSAKESVFKAWFPIARTWLGFEDAHVEFYPKTQEFRAHIAPQHLKGRGPGEIHGSYRVSATHIFTSAEVPAKPRQGPPAESE